jgi:hypothetical protein
MQGLAGKRGAKRTAARKLSSAAKGTELAAGGLRDLAAPLRAKFDRSFAVREQIREAMAPLLPGATSAEISRQEKMVTALARRGITTPDEAFGEYERLRRSAEAGALIATQRALARSTKMFSDFDQASRDKMGEAMIVAKENIDKILETGGPASANEQASRIMRDAMDQFGLSPEERKAVDQLRTSFREIHGVETEAGLLISEFINYTPIRYENIRVMRRWLDRRKEVRQSVFDGVPTAFTPAEEVQFKTIAQAEQFGYDPITDIFQIASHRYLEHHRVENELRFTKSLATLFGIPTDFKTAPGRGKTMAELLGNQSEQAPALDFIRRVKNKAGLGKVLVGDFYRALDYAPATPGVLASTGPLLDAFDSLQSLFKRGATVLRVAFSGRQLVGNTLQTAVATGKVIPDPSALSVALPYIMHGVIPDGDIITAVGTGTVYTGESIKELLKRFPVIKNVSIEGIGTTGVGTRKMVQRAAKRINDEITKQRIKGADPEMAKGLGGLMVRAMPFTDIPAKIEDLSRFTSFLGLLGAGHAPDDAFRLMEKGLFNYTRGITAFEETILSRVLPFYRFNRFASVLAANALATTPGRVINMGRVGRDLGSTWSKIEGAAAQLLDLPGGEELDLSQFHSLSTAERSVLPGFLFEQPTAFARMDPELRDAVFRTFNGMSMFDVLNFVQVDEKGEYDPAATFVGGGLAQVSPFLKVPFEILFKRDFFTGRVLDRERGTPIGPAESEEAFANLMGLMGSLAAGGTGGGTLLGRGAGSALNRLGASEMLRQVTGWEEAVDPSDGQRKVFVNPYSMIAITGLVPSFRDAFTFSRDDSTVPESAMRFLFGIGSVKLDLSKQQRRNVSSFQRKYSEQRSKIMRFMREGRLTKAEQARADLIELTEEFQENQLLAAQGPIRGNE